MGLKKRTNERAVRDKKRDTAKIRRLAESESSADERRSVDRQGYHQF